MPMDNECRWHQLGCRASKGISDTVQTAVSDGLANLVDGLIQGVVDTMTFVLTFWLRTPSSSLSSRSAVGGAIITVQDYLMPLTVFFGVLGLLLAAGRLAWTARAEPLKEMLRMMAAVVFVQALAITSTQMLLRGGDEFAVWLIEAVVNEPMQNSFVQLIPIMVAKGSGGFAVAPGSKEMAMGALLIVLIVILLAAIAQFLFLILRDVLLAVILVFLPTMAAASLTKGGDEAFQKAIGWIVALLLYKPVAAAIYALGVLMVKGISYGDSADAANVDWAGLLMGGLTLTLAVLAMPALVKFVAPAAGRGVSNAFSGGAALAAGAGVVAGGAAVVGLAATGGASAGAAGAGAAAGGGGGMASATGAAQTPAATASSTAAPTGGGSGTPGALGGSGQPGASGSDSTAPGGAGQAGSARFGGPEGSQGSSSDTSAASGASEADSSSTGSAGAPSGSDSGGSPGASGSGGNPWVDRAHAVHDIADAAQNTAGPSGSAIEEST
ncbi:hypothetical protein [Brachybacterium epidermidis]|uniref:hypothetical protein n=1 Tax=Brachybacterium epidermidis TaxID=2781983 RepID=UPI00398F51AD